MTASDNSWLWSNTNVTAEPITRESFRAGMQKMLAQAEALPAPSYVREMHARFAVAMENALFGAEEDSDA